MVAITELTDEEITKAVEQMKTWPRESAREVIEMEPNERDVVGLLAATLEAVPVDEVEE